MRCRLSFTELHFHLLPAVDDGPRTADESIELAKAAVADGTTHIVVTPHVHPCHITDTSEIPARTRELADRLRRERIELTIAPGGELAHTMVERLGQRDLERIAHGPRGARWLLLEAAFDGLDARFTAAADELRERGFAVLISHPERARASAGTQAALRHEVASGSAFQLTATAFANGHASETAGTALQLLRSAPRAVIASDAHGRDSGRMPSLRLAVTALRSAGIPDPDRFAGTIPSALLTRGLASTPARLAA